MKITKAIIPAAGLGTRLLPLTKCIAKELVPVYDTPAIQLLIEELSKAGIKEIFVIVSEEKKPYFEKFLKDDFILESKVKNNPSKKDLYLSLEKIKSFPKVKYIIQKKQLGLAHAILQSEKVVDNEAFVVVLPDDIIFTKQENATKQLIEKFNSVKKTILGCIEVPKTEATKYGVVETNDTNKFSQITNIIEKPLFENVKSNIVSIGRYLFTPKIFEKLKNISIGKSGEYELPSAIQLLMKDEEVFSQIINGHRFDVGTKIGYAKCFIYSALKVDSSNNLQTFIKELSKNNE